MKTRVNSPEALSRQAKSFAAAEGTSFCELFVEDLRGAIDARKTDFRLRKGSFDGLGLQEGIQWGSLSARAYE